MPIRNRSVMGGTSVQATPEEQNAARMNEAYLNAATQRYLADTQSNSSRYGVDASIGMNRENLSAKRDIEGTFDNRSQHEFALEDMRGQDRIANTRAGNEPAMAGIGLAGRQYDDVAPAIKAKSQAEAEKIQLMNALMKSYGVGAVPAGGAGAVAVGPMGGLDQSELALLAFGGSPGEIMKSRSDSKRYDREREAAAEANKMNLAAILASAGNAKGAAGLYKGVNGFKDMTDEELAGALQKPLDPSNVEGILAQKLPDFINRDTASAWSRGVKGATAGAGLGAGVGAAGGLFFGGIGAAPGAVGGGVLGALGGGLGGAFSKKGDPSDAEAADIKVLYSQLVEAYTAQNGGRKDLAIQQAKAKMAELGKTSVQGDDYLSDWDGDKTKLLFQGL